MMDVGRTPCDTREQIANVTYNWLNTCSNIIFDKRFSQLTDETQKALISDLKLTLDLLVDMLSNNKEA